MIPSKLKLIASCQPLFFLRFFFSLSLSLPLPSSSSPLLYNSPLKIEYQVPGLAPDEVHVLQNMANVSLNWTIVFVELHQHIGGINMTMEHFRDGNNLGMICAAEAIYGTGTAPGNETDYVVKIPVCVFETGYIVNAGDQLRLTSYYGPRTLPGGNPWHEGVMALAYVAAHSSITSEQRCLTRFHDDCGIPPYPSEQLCLACAKAMQSDLRASGCTVDLIKHECSKSTNGGNIPAPDEVPNMSLHVIPHMDGSLTFNITGPRNTWFAVGYNSAVPLMKNASAFVYGLPADSPAGGNGMPVVQLRLLGDHAPGTVLNANYPADVTTLDAETIQLLINVTHLGKTPLQSDANCYLFATGTSLTFDYHGATRGTTCSF